MLDNWDKRHGIWKLHKHCLPDCKLNTISSSTLSSNSNHVIIKFMHDSLELNLTLGHQITADILPDVIVEDGDKKGENSQFIKRNKIISRVLHWTLLKIEFTNPSRLMLMQIRNQSKGNLGKNGEDIKLAHYLLLRSLTPSRLAELCPNTKHLENTLTVISKVIY